jgi:uncharacterized protein (TIGR03437 family)
MCKKATVRTHFTTRRYRSVAVCLGLLLVPAVYSQTTSTWRSVGPSVIEKGLAGVAAGPVDRVWYSADGSVMYARTVTGRVYRSADLDHWEISNASPPDVEPVPAPTSSPESNAQFRGIANEPTGIYGFGSFFVYRSHDGGRHWDNLTAFQGRSLVGEGLRDLAVSPNNPDELLVAGNDGIFRSVDGGLSWSSLNGGFPNLTASRILELPSGAKGARVLMKYAAKDASVSAGVPLTQAVTLPPGHKRAWTPGSNDDLLAEGQLIRSLEQAFGVSVTAVASAGDSIYAGIDGGELRVSIDRGQTWNAFVIPNAGPVERIWLDPADPRIGYAVLEKSSNQSGPRVLRTFNSGAFWDDLTTNLPDTSVHGITADRETGSVYVATDAGVYAASLGSDSAPQSALWSLIPGLPPAPVTDVMLDAQSNQLWATVEGFGLYTAMAPHRVRDPRLVDSADWVSRAVAPGSLVTVLGAVSRSVRDGDADVPVLAALPIETQIQIPFDIGERLVSLTVSGERANLQLSAVPVIPAVPAIFVDRDGSPMILDTETGVTLDADHPARRGSLIQIVAAGLGRVTPEWPAGVPAPNGNEPRVAGTVRAYADRTPLQVNRAVLAPGYIGMYLVEVAVPVTLNAGPAELFVEVDGAPSNRVRVYIEP